MMLPLIESFALVCFTFAPAGIGLFASFVPPLDCWEFYMIGIICALAAGRAVYLSYKMPESKELVEAKERGGDLLATIVSYIECGFNLGITANAMHLHRNSMVYRLNRIAEKSGIDLLGSPQNYDLIALLITAKLYLSRLQEDNVPEKWTSPC